MDNRSKQPSTSYDFAQLSEFHAGLIYGFNLEASVQHFSEMSIEYALHGIGQYRDMFNAYMHAQQILEEIREKGIAHVTENQIIHWINELHSRIADTLAKDHQVLRPAQAGHPDPYTILRWHHTVEIVPFIRAYLANQLSKIEAISKICSTFDGIQKNDLAQFLDLLKNLQNNNTIQPPDYELPFVQRPDLITLSKLDTAYNNNLLSPEEKKIVEKFVKVCLPPKERQAAQRKFAHDFLGAWKKCDPNDIEQVTQLAADGFYGITEDHVYFNANGRLATCFMNIILRSLGKPSILMRYPNERDNPSSSYSKAIAQINTNRSLLENHIKNRLNEAINQPYHDDNLEKTVKTRFEIGAILEEILLQFPQYPLKETFPIIQTQLFQEKIQPSLQSLCAGKTQDEINCIFEDKFSLAYGKYCKIALKEILDTLKNKNKNTLSSPVTAKQYSPADKQELLGALQTITGLKGWKTYLNNGELTVLYEFDKHTEQDFRANICKKLKDTQAMQITEKFNAKTKNPVICITQIKSNRLIGPAVADLLNISQSRFLA